MTDDKKKDKKANEDGQEVKKVDDEQLKDVAGGTRRGPSVKTLEGAIAFYN